ncbi:Uma2 family endonuclease [Pelagerythrobacter sp.]|uniref:Uma2 family endonuclease n=1 Tax=Pelagerythrobacter sp. TaxID=2800702 RepID=UPI0035B123EC
MTAQELLDGQNKHRLTVEEFLMLDRAGAFGMRSAELFGGEVYYMSPKHRPHARTVGDLYFCIRQALEAGDTGLSVLTDISVRLSDHDAPEPDIVITNAPDGEGILPLEAAKLVIEVADSTLATDLGPKADLYAAAGVPEYWVVDVEERRVLMHAHPREDASGYDGQIDVPFGEPLHAATIEGLAVETSGLN